MGEDKSILCIVSPLIRIMVIIYEAPLHAGLTLALLSKTSKQSRHYLISSFNGRGKRCLGKLSKLVKVKRIDLDSGRTSYAGSTLSNTPCCLDFSPGLASWVPPTPPPSLHLFLEEMIMLRECNGNTNHSAEWFDKDNSNNNDKKPVYKLSLLSKGIVPFSLPRAGEREKGLMLRNEIFRSDTGEDFLPGSLKTVMRSLESWQIVSFERGMSNLLSFLLLLSLSTETLFPNKMSNIFPPAHSLP